MNKRRLLLTTGLLSLPGVVLRDAWAQNEPSDYEDVATPFPASFRLYGTNPARGPEQDMARHILEASPKNSPPLETAKYFESLQLRNVDGHGYNAQWPVRWNPVIIGFYQATTLPKPYVFRNGDTINWCAAFMNWCLNRGGYRTTHDAMSGSFRQKGGLGKATDNPVPGDIIVFRHENAEKAAVGLAM